MSGPPTLLLLLLSLSLHINSSHQVLEIVILKYKSFLYTLKERTTAATTTTVTTSINDSFEKNKEGIDLVAANADDDSEEDDSEAFNDIEDEDLICSNYVAAPKYKVLPHAVVIGARKGGTR